MKVLVIGGGGREHALVWRLAQSEHVTRIWCVPGNAGIAQERILRSGELVRCVSIGVEDVQSLLKFAQEHKPDLTVVGPENPLALGIVDLFKAHGLRIWGVDRVAARFEVSKAFTQEFGQKYGIPLPAGRVFTEPRAALEFAETLGYRCAVKADGLALGKGVLICKSRKEVEAALEEMMVRKVFGKAGEKIVIQELLEGVEVSLHAICDGETWLPFPDSQDHKRAFDGDTGPNTGGMGTYSPTPFLPGGKLNAAYKSILEPWMRGCHAEGISYCGLLYPGVMLTKDGCRVLEFNVRFGDPETQVYMARLDSDLFELLDACVSRGLRKFQLRWRPEVAVCIVMASGGYPGPYQKGKQILGLEEVARVENVKVFHAGTALVDDKVVTAGGRVLGVTAWAENLQKARLLAYEAVARIRFEGAFWRSDIGVQALKLRKEGTDLCGGSPC